jgi:hypothetical protein
MISDLVGTVIDAAVGDWIAARVARLREEKIIPWLVAAGMLAFCIYFGWFADSPKPGPT